MEFEGSKRHFDYVIWVDASKRKPLEPRESMRLRKEDADYFLDNNGPVEDLPSRIDELLKWLMERDEQVKWHLRGLRREMSPVDYLRQYAPEVTGDEATAGTETDRVMTPNLVRESHFAGSRAMGNYDIALSKNADDKIVAMDPRQIEVSFDNLQQRVATWADDTFGKAPHEFRFERLKQELEEILQDPQDPIEWADAMMLLFHGALEEGFTMTDILKACYEKLNRLEKREYTQDADGNWVYRPKVGYTVDDIK
jgi:hypothetical protein